MNFRPVVFALSLAVFHQAVAQEVVPAQALRYHTALLKTPENPTLFDRFFNAWLDEQPVEALHTFLTQNAANGDGAHLAILARFQLRRSLEDEALATLSRAIAARPDDPSLPMERASVLLRRLDFQNARRDLETVAASGHPTLSIDAAKLIGRSYLREGRIAEAIQTWDALLADHPQDLDLLEDLVESAAAEGRFDQAIQYIDLLAARSQDPYRATLAHLRRAELLARNGKNDEAARACITALANVGANSWLESEILAQFEKIHRSQDRVADLINALRTLADAHPHRALIHRALAKLEAEDGQSESAITRFREILRRSPGDDALLDEFITLLTTTGHLEDAIAELTKKIAITPADAELHLRLAALHAKLDDRPATLAALKTARTHLLATADEKEPVSLRIATLMLGYGLHPEAEALLTALAAAPNATPAPAETLANHYALTQRRAEAIPLLESAAATHRDPDTLIRIANTLARLGEPTRAHALLATRTEDLQGDSRFLTAITLAALACEDPVQAIPHATRLLSLATQETDIRDAVDLATRAIVTNSQSTPWREKLAAIPSPTPAEILLHASLAEHDRDFPTVATLLASDDPLITRFHVALLQRRGDFPAALAALEPLIHTSEARTPAFLKSLAELQIQTHQTDAALATLAQWKLAAPGDKSPWTIAIRHLESDNRLDEAITTSRRALAQFPDDPDFSAILATLFESSGSFADAEAIHWRLYDAATDPAEKSRIASRLAALAIRTSTTAALQENLERRALANRRSIAPILAQIELARLIDDQPALRDLLQQALRLQPENPTYRLQLADLEEKSHNPHLAIEWLQAGIEESPSNELRTALANLHIRMGNVLEGIRILRAIEHDPHTPGNPTRLASLTRSLRNAGMPEEAATFLAENLTQDPSHLGLRFLLATLLANDGRELEAIPILATILQDTSSVPDVLTPQYLHFILGSSKNWHLRRIQIDSQVPPDAPQARLHALILLSQIFTSSSPEIQTLIRNLHDPAINLILSIIHFDPHSATPADYLALIQAHPAHPGLWDFALSQQAFQKLNPASPEFTSLLDWTTHNPDQPVVCLKILAALLQSAPETPALFDALLASAERAADSTDPAVHSSAITLISHTLRKSTPDSLIPHHAALAALMLKMADSGIIVPPTIATSYRLQALAFMGRTQEWIDSFNQLIAQHRQHNTSPSSISAHHWHYIALSHSLPTLQRLQFLSLPTDQLRAIASASLESPPMNLMPATTLIPHLEKFSSPILRAFIAAHADDLPTARQILSSPSVAAEATDFKILSATLAIAEGDFPAAWNTLARIPDTASPITPHELGYLTAIYQAWKDDPSANITPHYEKILTASLDTATPVARPIIQNLINQHTPHLVTPTPTLGHAPSPSPAPSPAAFAQRSIPQSTTTRPRPPTLSPIEIATRLAAEENHTAAAQHLLQHLRQQSIHSFHPRLQPLKDIPPATRAAVLALTAPGDSPSLGRRLTHINTCLFFGETQTAIADLEKLTTSRPHEAALALKLAFLLPPDQSARAHALLTQAASSPTFAEHVGHHANHLSQNPNPAATLELITSWLESTPPEQIQSANLTWLPSTIFDTFRGQSTFPNLFAPTPGASAKSTPHDDLIPIVHRLTLAMMRHPAIAEDGFRIHTASTRWQIPPDTFDQLARQSLLASASHHNDRTPTQRSVEELLTRGNSQYLPLPSSLRWLTRRLSALPPDHVFPPDFLANLHTRNAAIGQSIANLAAITNAASLAAAWQSPVFESNDAMSTMIASTIAERSTTVPDALPFFISKINSLTWKRADDPFQSLFASTSNRHILHTALLIATAQDDAATTAVCSAIANKFIPIPVDWQSPEFAHQMPHLSSELSTLLGQFDLPQLSAIRIIRALTRLNIPVHTHEARILESWNGNTTPEQAIHILETLGLLENTTTWQPLAALTTNNRNPSVPTLTRITHIKFRFPNDAKKSFQQALSARLPTFGSLIALAALHDDPQRAKLTAWAFAIALSDLRKMPPDRLSDFATYLPWLPSDALATLPPVLQEQAKQQNAEALATLIETLDQVEKTQRQSTLNSSSLTNLIAQIIPLDFDLALSRFLLAEERHSAISPPQNFSAYREQALASILQTLARDPRTTSLALRFHNAIADSPAGTRFTFATTRDNGLRPILTEVGVSLAHPSSDKKSTWLTMVDSALAMPADLRTDALAAAAMAIISGRSGDSKINSPEVIEQSTGDAEKFRALVAAVQNFNRAKPEDRPGLITRIHAFLTDSTIRPSTRTQLAFLFTNHIPAILEDPAVVATIADLITPYCQAERSAVDTPVMLAVANISGLTITPENQPHLTRIHRAFWDNANTPKPHGHPIIQTDVAKRLLLASVNLQDAETTTRIMDALKADIIGDMTLLRHLITARQFAAASRLLPDESQVIQLRSQPGDYTPDLHDALIEFRSATTNPLGLLRYEALLFATSRSFRFPSELDIYETRVSHLEQTYRTLNPTQPAIQVELLAAIATSIHPAIDTLAPELTAFAATLDPNHVINTWGHSNTISPSQHHWAILCKAAAIRFHAGDPAPFAALCAAIIHSIPPGASHPSFHHTFDRLIKYLFPATFHAIAYDKTQAFAALVQPLTSLATAYAKSQNPQNSHILQTLALAELLAYASNTPEAFTPILQPGNPFPAEVTTAFAFPRREVPFANILVSGAAGYRSYKFLPPPFTEMVTALLSRPSLNDILPADKHILVNFHTRGHSEDIIDILANPPASITPAGRALLTHFHTNRRPVHNPDVTALRAAVADTPPGDAWKNFRIMAKLVLANQITGTPEGIAEARTLITPIPPDDVPANLKASYENLLGRINTAPPAQD